MDYVGNPVLDAIKSFKPNPDFLIKEGIDQSKKIVALLPGSRKMELKRIIPLMAEVVRKYPELQFVVAAVKNLPGELYKEIENYSNVKLVFDASYELLHVAQAAMVTSGTATLETAIFNVPQVVVYKTGRLEYLIAASVVKVEYISLVNLIAGKKVVKELIQREARLNSVGEELSRLVYDESYRKEMMTAYNLIYKTLDTGSASENTAGLMLEYLK